MKKNSEFVGVDEKFIPEDEKYVDESLLGNNKEVKEKVKKGGKIVIGIGLGYAIFSAVLFIIFFCLVIGTFIFIFYQGAQIEKDIINSETYHDTISNEISYFNHKLEAYSGTQFKLRCQKLLDDVVTNNKKNQNNIITVIYKETNTSEPNALIELKNSLTNEKYEVILDYDNNGLINKVTIQEINNHSDIYDIKNLFGKQTEEFFNN